MHGGERLAEVLVGHGVRQLFTLCGGHISPILTAAKSLGIRVVDVRDEATAVFAADATARLTGIPGVAAVTAGPGVTNSLTAIKNAQLAQSPLVILGGAAPTLLQGRGALQDIDQMALVRPLVKLAVAVRRVRELGPALFRAFQVARTGVPGPVFLQCPVDLLYGEAVVREWYSSAGRRDPSLSERLLQTYLRRHLSRLFGGAEPNLPSSPAAVHSDGPRPADLRRAARALARAESPLLLIGSQAMLLPDAIPQLTQAVTQLGLPVYLSGMARGLLGPEHPLQLRHQRRLALREADCVILAGVPCDFRLDYGRHIRRGATLIAANRSRRDLRLNRRPTLGARADAGEFLRRLAEVHTAPRDRWRSWLGRLRERDQAREREIAQQAEAPTQLVNPLRLCRQIDEALGERSVLIADGGDFVATASYIVRPRAPLSWLDPGVFGTLGVGAGFALGASLCRPGSEVWALFGDGALGYSLAEFDTFVRHGIPVIAVVGNDGAWTQIAREQVKLLEDEVGTILGRASYHEAAQAFGARGFLLKDPAQVEATLREARAAAARGQPVLVNAWIERTAFREGSISM